MKKITILAAFCAAAMLLTGCTEKTLADRESAAQQQLASGDLEGAKREIERALRDAAKSGSSATQQDRDRLNATLADINARIQARAIAKEDDERAAGAAALQAAKAAADRKDWRAMSRELSKANGHAKRANDPALTAAIAAMVASQPVKLVGAQAAYRSMCSKAGWSTAIEIFDGDPFWLDLNTLLDTKLERAVEEVGDAELRAAGFAVAKEWREYIRAKEIEKSTRDDNSTIGILINAGAAGARAKNRIEYIQAQTRFEKRMNELLGATVLPASTYQPQRRNGPTAPVATPAPVASSPVANTTGARNVVPTSVPSVAAPTAPASVRAATPPPTATPVPQTADRSAPNFDDLR